MMRIGKIGRILAIGILPLAMAVPAQAGGYGGYGHGFGHGHGGHAYSVSHSRHFGHHGGHGGRAGYAILGLGIGFLTGTVIANQHRQPETVVVRETVVQPQAPAAATQAPAAPQGTCLQAREYQTTVTIGGREVEAYGTACLQPDGSWQFSPPQVAQYGPQ